jgi:hypothetical protein
MIEVDTRLLLEWALCHRFGDLTRARAWAELIRPFKDLEPDEIERLAPAERTTF